MHDLLVATTTTTTTRSVRHAVGIHDMQIVGCLVEFLETDIPHTTNRFIPYPSKQTNRRMTHSIHTCKDKRLSENCTNQHLLLLFVVVSVGLG